MILILSPRPYSLVVMYMVLRCHAIRLQVADWTWQHMLRISKNAFSVCRLLEIRFAEVARSSGKSQTTPSTVSAYSSRRSVSICTVICATANACTVICGVEKGRVTPSYRCCKVCTSSMSCTPDVFSAGAEASQVFCAISMKPVFGSRSTAGGSMCIPAACAFRLPLLRYCRMSVAASMRVSLFE